MKISLAAHANEQDNRSNKKNEEKKNNGRGYKNNTDDESCSKREDEKKNEKEISKDIRNTKNYRHNCTRYVDEIVRKPSKGAEAMQCRLHTVDRQVGEQNLNFIFLPAT